MNVHPFLKSTSVMASMTEVKEFFPNLKLIEDFIPEDGSYRRPDCLGGVVHRNNRYYKIELSPILLKG